MRQSEPSLVRWMSANQVEYGTSNLSTAVFGKIELYVYMQNLNDAPVLPLKAVRLSEEVRVRLPRDPRLLHHRSSMTSSRGWEQQINRVPSAGRSSGSGW